MNQDKREEQRNEKRQQDKGRDKKRQIKFKRHAKGKQGIESRFEMSTCLGSGAASAVFSSHGDAAIGRGHPAAEVAVVET